MSRSAIGCNMGFICRSAILGCGRLVVSIAVLVPPVEPLEGVVILRVALGLPGPLTCRHRSELCPRCRPYQDKVAGTAAHVRDINVVREFLDRWSRDG
jgi:hypothetical protein